MGGVSRRRLLAGLGPVCLLSNCTSPNPALYTLAPVAGTPRPGGPSIVLLHAPSLARYLERPEIVRSSENYRVDVRANDWWGEPIGPMVGRVLAADLSERLPGTTVLADRGAISPETAASVEINIQRMDADLTGAVVLEAQAAVIFTRSPKGPFLRSVRFRVPAPSPDIRGQAAATSIALGRLADIVAGMLRRSGATV